MKRMFIVVIAIMFGFGLVGCNNDIKDGKFYSLEDAFDNGWLTNDDLSEIAEFYNNDTKPVELLDKDMEDRIKESYLKQLQVDVPSATIDDVYVADYFGTYNDCIIVNVWDNCIDYDLYFEEEKVIGTTVFLNYCSRCIFVYKINE